MVLVFKNVGGRSTSKNYRSVNLLSVVDKIFEKLVIIELIGLLMGWGCPN